MQSPHTFKAFKESMTKEGDAEGKSVVSGVGATTSMTSSQDLKEQLRVVNERIRRAQEIRASSTSEGEAEACWPRVRVRAYMRASVHRAVSFFLSFSVYKRARVMCLYDPGQGQQNWFSCELTHWPSSGVSPMTPSSSMTPRSLLPSPAGLGVCCDASHVSMMHA